MDSFFPAPPSRPPFPPMKTWLLTLLVITGCVGTLSWLIKGTVIPRFLAHANEERVADWHAAITECQQETGAWPDPADPVAFGEKIFVIRGADGRRIERGYMHARPGQFNNGVLYDAYDQPMTVTRTGDHLLIASAGPDKTWGTPDDVTSDQFKERHQPATVAQARAAAEERAQKRK